MSGDSYPVIHTVGSVDGPDQANLSGEKPGSTDSIPPRVPDSKMDKPGNRREEPLGNTAAGPEMQHGATSTPTSSEPGVIGEIRTVGSADPGGGDAGASSGRI
ncbi:hypothetical protein INS49_013614 [Diaporthe citri]|uniref:uncharacterized protein n=1 Tax=Diaporthe citri TaxID=83186 RepID=UPI001C7F7A6C|nr:uncharacterized protein INS49_013614 [Diaporthe citri]KAG6357735.1 hypothetical protein INS49_013614 [Diaporthe citri]